MTEHEIVYSLLNTVNGAEYNQDERITERLMRSYINTYRAGMLRVFYKEGHQLSDEVFQRIKLDFKEEGSDFSSQLPAIIQFKDRFGFYLEKNGITIPILNSEEYALSKKTNFSRNAIVSKRLYDEIFISIGRYTDCIDKDLYKIIFKEIENALNTNSKKSFSLDLYAVLNNPEDDPNYDWEKSTYPFPPEKIDELKYRILKREFAIIESAKVDEVQNSRGDNIRYQENTRIENG